MSVLVATASFHASELGTSIQSALSDGSCQFLDASDPELGTGAPIATAKTPCHESPVECGRQLVAVGGGDCLACLATEGWPVGYKPHFRVASPMRHPQLKAESDDDYETAQWRCGALFAFCRANRSRAAKALSEEPLNTDAHHLPLHSELWSHLEVLMQSNSKQLLRNFRVICVIIDDMTSVRPMAGDTVATLARCSIDLDADAVRCKDFSQAAAFIAHCRRAMLESVKRSMSSLFKTRPHVTFKSDNSLTVAQQTWVCQLTQVGQVGNEVARIVAELWKSPGVLSESFATDPLSTLRQIEELTVPTGRGKSRRIGPAVAKRLMRLFTAEADAADEALRVED